VIPGTATPSKEEEEEEEEEEELASFRFSK